MTLAEVYVKGTVILIDLLGPDIFSTLSMKVQVLHGARTHSQAVHGAVHVIMPNVGYCVYHPSYIFTFGKKCISTAQRLLCRMFIFRCSLV